MYVCVFKYIYIYLLFQDFIQDSNYFLIQEILDKVVYVNMEYKLLGQVQ